MVIAAAPTAITLATTIMTDAIFLFIKSVIVFKHKKGLFESLISKLGQQMRVISHLALTQR